MILFMFIPRCALLEIGRRTNFSMFPKTRLKDIWKYCKTANCEIRYLPVTISHLRVYELVTIEVSLFINITKSAG